MVSHKPNVFNNMLALPESTEHACDNPECALYQVPYSPNAEINVGLISDMEMDYMPLYNKYRITLTRGLCPMPETMVVAVDGVAIKGRFCRGCAGMFKIMGVL